MLHHILDLIRSIPPTYSKWETCALYLKHKVFYVACAKLNKIRDITPSWCKNTILYIEEIMVAMVFHGITTPLQIKLHLIKQTFPFMILNLFVGK